MELKPQEHDNYVLFEFSKLQPFDAQTIGELQAQLRQWVDERNQKVIISLPPKLLIEPHCQGDLLEFLQARKKNIVFTPQTALKWGAGWKILVKESLTTIEPDKARDWAENGMAAGEVTSLDLQNNVYIKLQGNAEDCLPQFGKKVARALAKIHLQEQPLATSQPVPTICGTTWIPVSSSIIIDFSQVFCLDTPLLLALKKILKQHKLKFQSPGLYYITSGVFQSWILQCKLRRTLKEIGNIVRVVAAGTKNEAGINEEISWLHQLSQQHSPQQLLLAHYVEGATNALAAIANFSPDIVIVDEMQDADFLKQRCSAPLKDKIYHITPATDPGVRILGPQLITKGYDYKLFAEYIISRYRNNRGYPNDTYFYYLDTHPEYLRKVTSFFLLEFAEILKEEHQEILQQLPQCTTREDMQGSFSISVFSAKNSQTQYITSVYQRRRRFFS